jgi:putative transposase
MKKSRYTAEQVVFALRQAESGTPVPEVCRKMEVSERRACNVIQLLRSTYRYRGVADEQAALRVGSVGKITWFRQRIEELISYNACLTAHSMDAVLALKARLADSNMDSNSIGGIRIPRQIHCRLCRR